MAGYRRIISVVYPTLGGASQCVARAAALAGAFRAQLAVLGAADHPPGIDQSLRAKASMLAAATAGVERLAATAGARGAEIMAAPRDLAALAGLALSWQPDLVVLAADVLPDLRGVLETARTATGGGTFDVLSVEPERTGLGQRLVSTVAGLLTRGGEHQ